MIFESRAWRLRPAPINSWWHSKHKLCSNSELTVTVSRFVATYYERKERALPKRWSFRNMSCCVEAWTHWTVRWRAVRQLLRLCSKRRFAYCWTWSRTMKDLPSQTVGHQLERWIRPTPHQPRQLSWTPVCRMTQLTHTFEVLSETVLVLVKVQNFHAPFTSA